MANESYLLRSHALSDGRRVRLRLAQGRDLAVIQALDCALRPLELARLLRSDPRERVVLCATALLGQRETVIGAAATTVGSEGPELLCAPDAEIEALLGQALHARVAAIAARRAA